VLGSAKLSERLHRINFDCNGGAAGSNPNREHWSDSHFLSRRDPNGAAN
jgi:hypothetical protein